jgi:TctA family transporter
VVHSFLDFIPSVFFGAPNEPDSMSVLPGHRLLLQGKGLNAVVCAASGSLIGATFSLCLCPLILLFLGPPFNAQDRLEPLVPGLLLSAAVLIIMAQRDRMDRFWTIKVFHAQRGRLCITGIAPLDHSPVRMSGQISRSLFQGYHITLHGQRWQLKGYRGPRKGEMIIEGEWRVRRRFWKNKAAALLMFLLSGALGFLAMQGRPPLQGTFGGWDGNLLLPLLTGLFSIPALFESSSSGALPEQEVDVEVEHDVPSAIQGAMAGLFAAWIPGVTATAGTILGTQLRRQDNSDPDRSSSRFIAMTASVGTAATVFGIMALCITGQGGTGVLVAIDTLLRGSTTEVGSMSVPVLALFLLSALAASIMGYFLTIWFGRYLASRMSGTESGRSSRLILIFEIGGRVCTSLPGHRPGLPDRMSGDTIADILSRPERPGILGPRGSLA